MYFSRNSRFSAMLAASTATAALCAAAPALADVTAEDVLQNIQAPLKALGATHQAEPVRKGNRLELAEARFTFALPMEAGEVAVTTNGLTLAENGDGTVSVIYPENMVISVSADNAEENLFSATLEMSSAAYTTTASGTPGDITYAYDFNDGTFALKDLKMPEEAGLQMTMDGTMTGMTGSYRITEGDIVRMEMAGTNGEAHFSSNATDFTGLVTTGTSTMSGGNTEMVLAIPAGKTSIMNLSQALRDGFSLTVTGKGGHIASTSEGRIDDEVMLVQNYSYNIGDLDYRFDETGFSGTGVNSDLQFEFVFGPMFPVPVSGTADKITGAMSVPVNKTDGPTDASMAMNIQGLAVNEALWAMIDPGTQLPRDPANLELDINADLANLIDLLNIEMLTSAMDAGETPLALHGLTLNSFSLDAVGAAVAAKGAFTFDNDDLETFGGFPAPDGAIDIEIDGANGLIDKLVGMGLLPEDQAMGARMMMGLFAMPGDGEDNLVSKIEIKPDGQILANGQRLQ